MAEALGDVARLFHLPPLVYAWLAAAFIRVATGSATNPYTGRTTASKTTYNPYTGNTRHSSASYNSYTGNVHRSGGVYHR